MKFSERYGYVEPIEVLKRGYLDKEGITSLCGCYDQLAIWFNHYDVNVGNKYNESYTDLEKTIWCFFMNERINSFYSGGCQKKVATKYLLSEKNEWYTKLELIEFTISVLRKACKNNNGYKQIVEAFIMRLNTTFIRLNYAYRVVDDLIVEITDEEEIAAIREALTQTSSIKMHISEALKLLSNRRDTDYRNSIKESISAVESLCREITGKKTLGEALKNLEKNGVVIPTFLKSGFEKLYVYTNDEKTGIRHALMNDAEIPTFEEAKFMLIACSAFVNYIQGKRK